MVRRGRTGFSLVELLIVIGVLGILLGLLLPAVQQARGRVAQISCLNNMKQIGVSLIAYHDVANRFPPTPSRGPDDPNELLGWMALILPQMEQDALYKTSVSACRLDSDVVNNPPHVALATVVKPYLCPADSRLTYPIKDRFQINAAFTSYVGNGGGTSPYSPPAARVRGFSGVLGASPGCPISAITDGTSNTIMVGERPPPDSFQAGWWYPAFWEFSGFRGPNNFLLVGAQSSLPNDGCFVRKGFGPGRTDNPCDRFHYWSQHRGGANFLFADGSARFLPYSFEPMIYNLLSRDGGEIVELP